MREIELQAKVHLEEGMYWAEVPSHPGLFASGETLDELTEALAEAWLLYAHGAVEHASESSKKRSGVAVPKLSAGRVDQLKLPVPA